MAEQDVTTVSRARNAERGAPDAPGREQLWPHGVDMYQRGTKQAVERWVQSASVLHTNGDGIAVHDGGIDGGPRPGERPDQQRSSRP
jgi:hypothetical protein